LLDNKTRDLSLLDIECRKVQYYTCISLIIEGQITFL